MTHPPVGSAPSRPRAHSGARRVLAFGAVALAGALGALASPPASAAPTASLPGGAYLFVAENSDTSATVRAFSADGAEAASFATTVGRRMVTGSAGSRLYVAGGSQVEVVDTASQQSLGTMVLANAQNADPENLSVTADGRRATASPGVAAGAALLLLGAAPVLARRTMAHRGRP